MKAKYNNLIALIAVAVFLLLLTAFVARSEEWEQTDRDGKVWIVTIGHAVDCESLEKSRKDVDVRVEIITYGHDWTRLVLSDTGTTDWESVMRWVGTL